MLLASCTKKGERETKVDSTIIGRYQIMLTKDSNGYQVIVTKDNKIDEFLTDEFLMGEDIARMYYENMCNRMRMMQNIDEKQ